LRQWIQERNRKDKKRIDTPDAQNPAENTRVFIARAVKSAHVFLFCTKMKEQSAAEYTILRY
jgi:hypothetical protein